MIFNFPSSPNQSVISGSLCSEMDRSLQPLPGMWALCPWPASSSSSFCSSHAELIPAVLSSPLDTQSCPEARVLPAPFAASIRIEVALKTSRCPGLGCPCLPAALPSQLHVCRFPALPAHTLMLFLSRRSARCARSAQRSGRAPRTPPLVSAQVCPTPAWRLPREGPSCASTWTPRGRTIHSTSCGW